MKTSHLATSARHLAVLLSGAGLVALSLTVSGCQERIEHTGGGGTWAPLIAHPQVDRDLDEIESGGVLRLITPYNSNSYFIHKGGQTGFDYELLDRFARKYDVTIEVVIPAPGENMISLLNSGRGDVVCAGLTADLERERTAAQTRPVNFAQKVLVLPAASTRSPTLDGLAGLTVTLQYDDPFRDELQHIRGEAHVNFLISRGQPLTSPETLIAQVAGSELDAVVVDDIVARAALAYEPGIRIGSALGKRRPIVWLVRRNSVDLQAAVNKFLRGHLYVAENGRQRRSQTYGIIYDRYFENPQTIRDYRAVANRPDKSGTISEYDDLIRRRSEAAGLDWRVVAAQIYQESRFYRFARSRADARGLMQVLPRVAGAQADSLYDPAANLTAGLRLLRGSYQAYAYMDSLERWRFALAEYHAGHGHLTDARRIAMEMGRDPNLWQNSVAVALPKLMERKYFSGVRHGFYGGARTVQYVDQVMNRARIYIDLVDREAPASTPADSPPAPEPVARSAPPPPAVETRIR